MKKTGFFIKDTFLDHELEPGHPESPERLSAIESRIRYSAAYNRLEKPSFHYIPDVHKPFMAQVHTSAHIDEVLAIPSTGTAASDATAAVMAAVDGVFSGTFTNAFCAVRPPGHHAYNNAHNDGKNMGQGFCFLNNVAIAARYAQKKYGAEKILVVDWDFHHGNGTEAYFYEDPSVFYFSTHRFGAYPGTGLPSRKGAGAGEGYTFNYPLPRPGYPFDPVSDSDFVSALSLINNILPEVGFTPDFILISAGFDGLKSDPLGNFSLSETVFRPATDLILELAERSCDGRIVSVLEGGYNPASLAAAVEIHIKALTRFSAATIIEQ